MDDHSVSADSMIRRIADALGIPIDVFCMSDREGRPRGPSAAEINALLAAFMTLTDQQARRRVIAAASTEANRTEAFDRGG